MSIHLHLPGHAPREQLSYWVLLAAMLLIAAISLVALFL